jgi:hypothetical protein
MNVKTIITLILAVAMTSIVSVKGDAIMDGVEGEVDYGDYGEVYDDDRDIICEEEEEEKNYSSVKLTVAKTDSIKWQKVHQVAAKRTWFQSMSETLLEKIPFSHLLGTNSIK